MGQADRLQISPDGIGATQKVPKRGPLLGPQQHFQRPRRKPENLHENLVIILLARIVHIPAKKKDHHKANTTATAANSGALKLEDPCRFIRANVDS
jgi:hypothetical protein